MPRTRSYGLKIGLQSGGLPYRYELVPYAWVAEGGRSFWRLPASAVGGVDLRTLAAMSAAGGAPQGHAFATCLQGVGGTALATSYHMSETPATAGMRSAWQAVTGYNPAGATLTDLLWDQLTAGSDPSGAAGPKPLVPGVDNVLRLYVGGHSLVKAESFRWGHHPHTNRLRDLLRRQFDEQWEAADEAGRSHARRCLDYTCIKYRVSDWREFVPQRLHGHVPGRLPHATTITESFNKADSDVLGPDLTWTELAGDIDVVSNRAQSVTVNSAVFARADSDLSSDDHYAQAVMGASADSDAYGGVFCRAPGTATQTWYTNDSAWGENLSRLVKKVAGADTTLGSVPRTFTAGTTYTLKVQADGSTVAIYVNDVEDVSVTDTAITGNLRGGLNGYKGGSGHLTWDSFEAADLAAVFDPANGFPWQPTNRQRPLRVGAVGY